MVKGLSDTLFINSEKQRTQTLSEIMTAKNDAIPAVKFSEIDLSQMGEAVSFKKRNVSLTSKMANYIKNEEAGERHTTPDGKYVVYRGEADKSADNKNDSIPLLTVGHGHTERGQVEVDNRILKEGDTISKFQAEELFKKDIKKIENTIINNEECSLRTHVTQGQSDAIISYAFNAGVDKLRKSDPTRAIPESMIECINNGEIGKAQSKFNIITAGGLPSKGLAKRRIVEMVIFGEGKIYKEAEATFGKNKKTLGGWKILKHVYEINSALEEYGIKESDRMAIVKKLIF